MATAVTAASPDLPDSGNSIESGEEGAMPLEVPPEDAVDASEAEADMQTALAHVRTACTSNVSNPDPGDAPPGIWSNPKRSSTGWTLAYDGARMRVLWHTFYPRVGGGMTWLASDSAEVQRAGPNERVWSAGAYRPKYRQAPPFSRIGRITLAFPQDSATRAAVVWRWDSDNGAGRALSNVECIYSFGNDSPAARGPSLEQATESAPPPATDASARGPFYTGIWTDPSTPGFEAAVSMINPFHELVTLNIYDQNKEPTWVSAQIPLLPSGASGPTDWPSTAWVGGNAPAVDRTEVDLVYRTAKYDMSARDCESLAGCVEEKRFQRPGNFFGRAYYSSASSGLNNAVMGLRIASASPVAINWPPNDWPAVPAGSDVSGCPTDSPRNEACRPVKRITDQENLTVSPPNCDLQNQAGGVCKVNIAWNASILAYVERLDADTQRLLPMIRDGKSDDGIVGASAWGRAVDEFRSERRLLYRLRVANRLVTTRSVRVGESTISATRCVIPYGSTQCETQVSWRTPDAVSPGSPIKIYRSVSRGGAAPVYEPNGPWEEYKSVGSKNDTIRSNEVVVYSVRRVGPATSTHLAVTSYVIPVSAYVKATPNACSVPLNDTTCPTRVSWLAGSANAKVFRKDLVGSAPDKEIAAGIDGTDVIDKLTAGSRVQYVVKVFAQPQGASNDVSAIASRIWTSVPNCIVPSGQKACTVTVNWNSVDGARIYRLNESTQVLEPLKDDSGNDVAGFSGSVDDLLAPGARVHYEVRIGGAVHAVTPTTTASTDSEGGDASDGGTVDMPPPRAPFADPGADVESDKVGAIAGEFRVDEAGGASYRIPLATPPGAGGLSPSLALVYNSNGADGAFGTGFSLEGASAIVACRPGVETGDAAGPTAEPSEFCLDGQRLLLVRGTHRQVGAEYRTEIESFQRVRLTALEGIGIARHDATGYVFTVQGKDGSVRTFGGAAGTVSAMATKGSDGSTTQAGLEPAPVQSTRYTAQAWLQTQLRDVAGNAIAFQYGAQTATGERYLDRVNYAGGSVAFEYQDSGRPDVAYSVLGPRRQSKLVSGIEVKAADGSTLRYYEPTYNTAVSDPYVPAWARGRPVLFSLRECSARNGVCYPATRLGWSFASAYTDPFEGNLPVTPGGYYKVGDFNGDKRADIWWTTMSNGQADQSLRISTFTSDSPNGPPTLRTIDPGMRFPNGYLNGGLWEVFDGDGDGRDDLLYAFNTQDGQDRDPRNRMDWYLRRSTGTGLGDPELMASVTIDWAQCRTYSSKLAVELQAAGISENQPSAKAKYLGSSMLADVDGDGLADLVFRACDGKFWVALMKRTGNTAAPYALTPVEVKFLNEAGSPLSGDRCGYGTANLWRKEENFSQATDFDGDGRADLRFLVDARRCLRDSGDPDFRLDVFLSKGIAADGTFVFQASRPFGAPPAISVGEREGIAQAGQKIRTLDVNGDGLTDLVYLLADGKWRYRLGGPYAGARDAQVADSLVSGGFQADPRYLQLLDFDGDGKLDLWNGDGTDYSVWLWRGDNWSSTAIVRTDYPKASPNQMSVIGDFDGDGSIDSFLADTGGTKWNLRRSKAHHKPRGVVTTIENGFGAVTRIDYGPLTFSSLYRRDHDAPFFRSGRGSAVFDVAAPSYAVRSVSSSAPTFASANAKATVTYRYAGLKVQAGGRGSLGFRRVSSYDVQNKTEVDSYYTQRFPYTGLSYFTQTRVFDPASRVEADPCGSGVTATADSPACMKYVPPCAGGLNSACDDDLPGISNQKLVVKESSDTWQWRSGSKLGALTQQCVSGLVTGEAGADAAAPLDLDETMAVACPGGWYWAQPDEVDQLALRSAAPAPIFLARIHSLTGNYDLGEGIPANPGDVLSSESVDFAMADYDDYGNPRAGRSSKSGGGATVDVASTFLYDNDEPNWKLGRLQTATAVTTRVTKSDSGTVRSSNTRKSSFTYDARGMLESERVEGVKNGSVDAGAPTVAKYYAYDTFGNRTGTFVCSTRISQSLCRQQTAQGGGGFAFHPDVETDVMRQSGAAYDPSGRFADTTYELFQASGGAGGARQLASSVAARTPSGDPLEIQDFNGTKAKIRYGTLGRKRFSWSQDGASTRWEARYCSGVQVPAGTPSVSCPANLGLVYRATTTKSGAPTSIAFHDVLGRPVLTLTQGFASNTWSAAMVQYDAVGNVARQYDPFFATDTGANAARPAGATALTWTETSYDALSRPTTIRHTGTGATTRIGYSGLRTVTTLPPNGVGGLGPSQTLTEIRNGLGETVRSIDANGYEVATLYDAAGNPETIRRGSLVTTMVYDTLGRKIGMSDPDAGSGWSYAVNGAGEVIRQTSPRGACTKNDYDGRGRVWRRRDYGGACATLESTATWVYDTASAGQPTQESNGQLARNFFYDDLGRPARTETSLDGKNYVQEWTFDPFGRPFQQFFQAPGQPRTGEQNRYEGGYLREIRSAYPLRDGRVLTYREIQAVNARGQAVKERAAPGMEYSQERRFDDDTGRLREILVQSVTAGILQNVRYDYDLIGNVTSRIDGNGPYALTEEFGYDALQRLTSATVRQAGQTTYVRTQSYDAQGNILAKSDVGTPYRYGQREPACSGYATPGPHAVSAAGSNTSLCYDANGNVARRVTSQGTQTIAYTAADQVSDIRDGVNRVGFRYGPSRERVRRLDYAGAGALSADTVVHEVGGAQIRYTATSTDGAGALQEVRRYVGNVLVVQSGSGANYRLTRQVLLTDRQGSTHQVLGAMTLQPVNAASPSSFDAWGQRRDAASWGAAVPWTQGLESLLRSSTTHGYTGHEMAESVGVIHMNGRIYDPQLARFLQADPFVQSPGNGQNWNRYSYTFNNPLAYTDPSGYLSVGDIARMAAAVAISYWTGGMAAGVIHTAGSVSAAVSSGAIWNAAAWTVAGGFAAGAVQSGSLKGAVAGAVSSGLFFGIGTSFSQGVGGDWMFDGGRLSFEGYAAKTLSHGMAGGVMETLQGGRFGHGFLSAGVSEALSPVIGRAQDPLAEGILRSVVGGTASVAGGGKFANGAVTAAFGYAFNSMAHMAMFTANKAAGDIEQVKGATKSLASNFVDELLGFIPGYDVARCASSGTCNSAEWGLAAVGAFPPTKAGSAAVKMGVSIGREINLIDRFYQTAESAFKFSEYYYKKLWATGRGAPFLQAEEVLNTATKVVPDRMPGFNRYTNDHYEMIYNPTTKEVWHLQPRRD
ncbi:RHS repeat-associated core domain-containing protein [Dokdonella ginsengisoli]|uniref:RHS repeat-associated core domain-containing protein n=1 Tax=Dokdonella ginsengisoli TaxID=363846 RepID=A0ABV9QTW0_9GAMM